MESILTASYAIHFSEKGEKQLARYVQDKKYSKVFILTDTNTREFCLPVLLAQCPTLKDRDVFSIPAGEQHKNIQSCIGVWEWLSGEGADRNSLLINLGGGVLTDLGGFVASTYQRGIAFVNIPTTLLSMVDASVGGKTGIDLGKLKNQIGLIRQPEMVVIQPDYLKTLELRQIKSGFAEMLKHGLIQDRDYWQELSEITDYSNLKEYIYRSVVLKNEVVLKDPLERNIRKMLNFGHTLGHAIESYFLDKTPSKQLLHGEAIAIGMIMESMLSVKLRGMSPQAHAEIKSVFAQHFPHKVIDQSERSAIISLLRHDKKNTHGKVLFSLLDTIGSACIDMEVPEKLLLQAFDDYAQS
ncbi:3-dehydroquinate synthase [Robiginitalea sp. IMCC44478]|uniref:3-dehydroquinate synthase n=1 Tax=Robiginitalea sp. IMCC44478 TaxID=3459122 RepID=UPI0040428681